MTVYVILTLEVLFIFLPEKFRSKLAAGKTNQQFKKTKSLRVVAQWMHFPCIF